MLKYKIIHKGFVRLNPNDGEVEKKIYDSVKQISPLGKDFYIISVVPDQLEDRISVLIDNIIILDFEINRKSKIPKPENISINSVKNLIKANKQGKFLNNLKLHLGNI